jgi:hypothetical protein
MKPEGGQQDKNIPAGLNSHLYLENQRGTITEYSERGKNGTGSQVGLFRLIGILRAEGDFFLIAT